MIETQTDYQAPETLDAALQLMDSQGYQLLSRGSSALRSTDIKRHNSKLVSLRKVRELTRIDATAGALLIGASATFDQLLQSALVQPCPALVQALQATPEPHQRHSNTLGGAVHEGGLIYAPALAALIALDATAEFVSRTGKASQSIASLGSSGKRTSLTTGTLVSRIDVAAHRLPASLYLPLDPVWGRRPYQGIAIALKLASGQVQELRLVLAGFSDFPLRLSSVEDALQGGPLNAQRSEHAATLLGASHLGTQMQPEQYALHLARVLVRRALTAFSPDN